MVTHHAPAAPEPNSDTPASAPHTKSLDQQMDALTAAGVRRRPRVQRQAFRHFYAPQRPGLAALLDYAREGDAIVVVGIDRLGRNAAEVMTTIRDLGERGIVLRSLREGIDTSNATGRMVAGVLASLAELELELGKERRIGIAGRAAARGQSIGRPRRWTSRRWRWPNGCMPAVNPRARSRRRWALAGQPSTGRSRKTLRASTRAG